MADNKPDFKKWLQMTLGKKNDREDGVKKKITSYQYVLSILGIGIALMLFGGFLSPDQSKNQQSSPVMNQEDKEETVFKNKTSLPSSMTEYEEHYENQLKDILESIYGVSEVKVMVTLDSSAKKIISKNRKIQSQHTSEEDTNGGSRDIEEHSQDHGVVILNNGEGEQPLIIGKKNPEIQGVMVSAEGADNIKVKSWIMEAVSRVLDIPYNRISVIPQKTKGD